jgi:hypothetical protein
MRCASRVKHVHGVRRVARHTPACDQTGNGARAAAPRLSLHTSHAPRVGGWPGPARALQGSLHQMSSAAWLPAPCVRRGAPLAGWVQWVEDATSSRVSKRRKPVVPSPPGAARCGAQAWPRGAWGRGPGGGRRGGQPSLVLSQGTFSEMKACMPLDLQDIRLALFSEKQLDHALGPWRA